MSPSLRVFSGCVVGPHAQPLLFIPKASNLGDNATDTRWINTVSNRMKDWLIWPAEIQNTKFKVSFYVVSVSAFKSFVEIKAHTTGRN